MNVLTSLRAPKVGPFAIFDLATAFAGMYLLAPRLGITRERALWATIPVGVAAHVLIGKETPLNRMVFGPGYPVAKLAVSAMAFKAIKG